MKPAAMVGEIVLVSVGRDDLLEIPAVVTSVGILAIDLQTFGEPRLGGQCAVTLSAEPSDPVSGRYTWRPRPAPATAPATAPGELTDRVRAAAGDIVRAFSEAPADDSDAAALMIARSLNLIALMLAGARP